MQCNAIIEISCSQVIQGGLLKPDNNQRCILTMLQTSGSNCRTKATSFQTSTSNVGLANATCWKQCGHVKAPACLIMNKMQAPESSGGNGLHCARIEAHQQMLLGCQSPGLADHCHLLQASQPLSAGCKPDRSQISCLAFCTSTWAT